MHTITTIITLCSMMATKTMSWTLVWEVEAAAPNATPSAGDKTQSLKHLQQTKLKQSQYIVSHFTLKIKAVFKESHWYLL